MESEKLFAFIANKHAEQRASNAKRIFVRTHMHAHTHIHIHKHTLCMHVASAAQVLKERFEIEGPNECRRKQKSKKVKKKRISEN